MTREEAKAIVTDRIFNGEPFTFARLSPLCGDVDGMKEPWRVADGLIQSLRKKGVIAFERKGRETIWSLTAAGKAEAERRAAA